MCPAIPVYVKNCYNSPSRLFIIRRNELKSNESTTQNDPVSIAIYGIGVTLMINILIDIAVASAESQVGVLAYANNFSAAGTFGDLRKWWDTLTIIGRKSVQNPVITRDQQKLSLWLSHMQRSEQIRCFLEPKLKSPIKGTSTLEGQLVRRNLRFLYGRKGYELD